MASCSRFALFLTGYLAFGFQAALAKPFTRHELANVLQRALETKEV